MHACAFNGNRFLIYGGEVEGDGNKDPPKTDFPPSDELWSLDLENASWTQCNIRGVSPGKLSYGAAACVGNKCFFFGGWNGEGASDGFFGLDTVSMMWEPIEDNAAGPRAIRPMGPQLTRGRGQADHVRRP